MALANQKGDILLMPTAYHGHADTMKARTEMGAASDRANDRGVTPTARAVFRKESGVVRTSPDGRSRPAGGHPVSS